MGWLAAQGAIMAIGLFIGLVCSVIVTVKAGSGWTDMGQ